MIYREGFLSDLKGFLVSRKCFRVLTHVVIHQTDVVIRSSQTRMIFRKSFLFDLKRFFVKCDRFFIFSLIIIYPSKLIKYLGHTKSSEGGSEIPYGKL
jgi:hypothetical protein